MEENKFEDSREKLLGLLELLIKDVGFKSEGLRNKEFERDIQQIFMKKSTENFELFVYAYDVIFEREIKDFDEFDAFINRKKDQKIFKRLWRLYDITLDDKKRTIELALKIYSYHKGLINQVLERRPVKASSHDDFDHSNRKQFDIFLSHRYKLKIYNLVVYYVLTVYYGLEVYIDWIYDQGLNRSKIGKKTAQVIKKRMNQSKKLLFFNILNEITTTWMSWEVGYFSCCNPDSIGILDLDDYCTGNKSIEVLSSHDRLIYNSSGGIYVENTTKEIDQWIN